MTPWQYIGSGFFLLVLSGVMLAAGVEAGFPPVTWGASVAGSFATVLVLIGVVGQGVKISQNR